MKEFSWKSKINILIGLLFFLCLWQISAIIIDKEIYLPKLQSVFYSIIEIVKDKDFIKNVSSSMGRSLISFFSALILAIILSILAFCSNFFRDFIKPFNAIGKTIPTMVLVVLALIWFDKDKAPYVVGFAIVYPILFEGIFSELNNVDKKLIEMCSIYNVSMKNKILKIYFPVLIRYLIDIFMSSFSLAFKVVIAGEVHGQPDFGIGAAIQRDKVNFEITNIFAWIVLIALFSIIFELINKKVREINDRNKEFI